MKKKLKEWMIEACDTARDCDLKGRELEKYVKNMIKDMLTKDWKEKTKC